MGKVSRKSVSLKIWDKFVGTSKDNFPWTHLPTNKVVLQRYRGLRNGSATSGMRDSKSEFVEAIWVELETLWALAHIPTIVSKNGKKRFCPSSIGLREYVPIPIICLILRILKDCLIPGKN